MADDSLLASIKNLAENEGLVLSFPIKHQGTWHQVDLMIGADNSFGFQFDGEESVVGLEKLMMFTLKRKEDS